MIRRASSTFICLVMLALPASAFGQAIVESAIVTSASGTAAAGAKGAGAAAAGVFENLRKTLAGANQPSSAGDSKPTGLPASQVFVTPPDPEALKAVEPKDVSGIVAGLTRQELTEKYGRPALKVSEQKGDQVVEIYTYMQAKNDPVTVTLRDGVVSAVVRRPNKPSLAVVTLR